MYIEIDDIREVKHTNVYVNVYVCLKIHAYYVIMTSSVLNSAKIYKLYITCKLKNTRRQELVAYKIVISGIIHESKSFL